jgi:transcriptional regulator with AAA-type ATPase domain
VPQPVHQPLHSANTQAHTFNHSGFAAQQGPLNGSDNNSGNGSGNSDDPMTAIAKQLRRLFAEQGDSDHFDKLESLIVHEAFAHVRSNQVHGAALLGISRNVMRTLLKRHGLLADAGFTRAGDNSDQEDQLQNLNPSFAG